MSKQNLPMITIDVGYGGSDSGASSKVTKLTEKTLNLIVALKLRDQLIARGFKVNITRSNDSSLIFNNRIKLINQLKGDITVSIHHNASNGQGFGAETIYATNHPNSKRLAECIGNQFATKTKLRRVFDRVLDNGLDYYGLIRQTRATTTPIICEYGFVDNINDAKLLDEQGLMVEADLIYKGICDYYRVGYEVDKVEVIETINKDSNHWAKASYDLLNSLGVEVSETRFDDAMTRGEMMALIARVIEWVGKK